MKRGNLVRGLVLLVVAAFFGWQAWRLGDAVHIALLALFGLAALLTLAGWLKEGQQSLAMNAGISLAFLDYVFAELNLSQVVQALAEARWSLLGLAVFLVLFHLIFRIWRWQWLLKPLGEIPFGPAFRAGMIGIGGNMILPARAGEFLRAYAIGRSSRISMTGAFATVVVERIFDGLTVLLLLLGLIIFGVRDEQLQRIGLIGGAFYLIALAGIVLFMWRRSWFEAVVRKLLPQAPAERVLKLLDGFATGLEALSDGRQLFMISLLSLITWTIVALSFWPVIEAFDFGAPVPFFASFLILPLVALGLTLPTGPAGVGNFEFFALIGLRISLAIAGTPLVEGSAAAAVAAACVVVMHASHAIPEALLGIWAFFAEGLTTGDLRAGREI
ncbi:MAG: lysylphosphatidylglycerol synthase transmembrane domain-containing protein [Anaerolineae bacterium]